MSVFIVTRANSDGSFDNVGMNNRFQTSDYKTLSGLLRYGIPPQYKHRTIRIQDQSENVLGYYVL